MDPADRSSSQWTCWTWVNMLLRYIMQALHTFVHKGFGAFPSHQIQMGITSTSYMHFGYIDRNWCWLKVMKTIVRINQREQRMRYFDTLSAFWMCHNVVYLWWKFDLCTSIKMVIRIIVIHTSYGIVCDNRMTAPSIPQCTRWCDFYLGQAPISLWIGLHKSMRMPEKIEWVGANARAHYTR